MMSKFEQTVDRTILAYRMFQPGDEVLVMVSGGPDSVSLLRFLHANANVLGITLHVYHLDHMLRRDVSTQEAIFVQKLCAKLSLACTSSRIDVRSVKANRKGSMQVVAREVRKEDSTQVAEEAACTKIATAHHLDDRIETFLMRVMRGTGIYGLGSIRHVAGMTVRPLLDVSKSQIIDYLDRLGQTFCTDESNLELKYARNRVRATIAPEFLSQTPNAREELREVMDGFEQTAIGMDETAAKWSAAANRHIYPSGTKTFSLSLDLRRLLSSGTSNGQLVRMLFLAAFGNELDPERGHINALTKAIISDVKTEVQVMQGLTVVLDMKHSPEFRVIDIRGQLDIPPADLEISLEPNSRADIRALNLSIKLSRVDRSLALKALNISKKAPRSQTEPAVWFPQRYSSDPPTLVHYFALKGVAVDEQTPNTVDQHLLLTAHQMGDRMGLRGSTGTRLVSDILIDQKIPRAERAFVPLVRLGRDVVLIPGYGPAKSFEVSPESTCVYKIEILAPRSERVLNPL